MEKKITPSSLRAQLRRVARPENVAGLQRFFRTGPGEYGAGDRFIGVRVPDVRKVARLSDGLTIEEVVELLGSAIHEERLLALVILVRRSERATPAERGGLAQLYLEQARQVNNWDLVDSSAPQLLGAWVLEGAARVKTLERLARSDSLWERRIAMVATQKLIRAGVLEPTWKIAAMLLRDPHDLMHKAAGWMLREAGARDAAALTRFLEKHGAAMPRTMLRYAIEHRSEEERKEWLRKTR